MIKETPLPKNIIDEILIFVYVGTDEIMWYLLESGRIFSESTLRNYNICMLEGIIRMYRQCHKDIMQNMKRDSVLTLILEQQGIPFYAGLIMLKGRCTYNRLRNEQISVGECINLNVVFPLKTITSTLRACRFEKFLRDVKKPTNKQERFEYINALKIYLSGGVLLQ